MPTFTTIALESLLEPKIRDSYKTSTKSVRDFSGNDKRKKELDEEEQQQKLKEKAPVRNRVNMSSALYITPDFSSYTESVAEEHARRSTTSIDYKISKAIQQRSVPNLQNEDSA